MMLQKASRGLPEGLMKGFSRASRGLPKGFLRASWRFGSFLHPVRSLTFLTERTVLTYQLNVKWKNWIIRFCCLCYFKKILLFQEIPPQVSNRQHHQRHTLYPSQSFKSPSQNPEIQNQNGGSTINYDIEAIKLDRHSDQFQNICPKIIY